MSEIRAFVGHSFTEDDSALVDKFLKYFEQIANSNTSFSWVHAESAEPKQLAEKVMSLISTKNVFIGICTKKEYAINPHSLMSRFLPRWFARKEEFFWKTSDWIIQEIGLAKGKGLDLILLVENGLRKPGGLQGDVEYISFDRITPERSFGKILDMITALSPRVSSITAKTSDMKSRHEDEPSPPSPPEREDWHIPKPEWTRQNYGVAYILATDLGHADPQAISSAYLMTAHAAQNDNRISWDAFCEFTRLKFAKGGSLSGLKELAMMHPHSSRVLAYLARGFEIYQDHESAAQTYETASKEAHEDDEQIQWLKAAAVAHASAGSREAASGIIARMKDHLKSLGTGEIELLNTLRTLVEIDNDNDAAAPLMERAVSIDPSDIETRFSLGYKYSQTGNNDLALFRYLRIPPEERSSTTWNNLGVAFANLSLPARSVDAYRKAEQMGDTLAMSNIAERLITVGFLPEAQQECEDALKRDGYDNSVVATLATVKGIPSTEDDAETEILKKIKPVSEFYVRAGRAMTRSEPQQMSKYWKGPDCVLEISVHGSEILALGGYQRQVNPLALASAFGQAAVTEHYQIEYRGTWLAGAVIKARVTRTPRGDKPRTLSLLSATDESSVIMIVTDDGNDIQVMETTKGASARFYALTREEGA
jgi:tetratricopeptide (TPR) repeat protein